MNEIAVTLDEDELKMIISALIKHCEYFEEISQTKEDLACYGYYNRQALIKKLKLINNAYYPYNTYKEIGKDE